MGGIREMLTKEQMKKVIGGYGYDGTPGGERVYSCQCRCNSGVGPQPSYQTTYPTSSPSSMPGNESACGCSTYYMATSPGYNSSSCSPSYNI